MYQIEETNCIICGSNSHTVIWDKREREKQGILRSVVIRDTDNTILHHTNVMCNSCGLVYIRERMTKESLDKFYEEDYRKIYKASKKESQVRSELQHAKNAYTLIRNIEGDLLDIGCSTGQLIDLWKVNMNGNAKGVEKSEFKPQYLHIYNDIDEVKEKFDVVTMLNSLEHMYNPVEVLTKAHDVLNDNGHVLISVPDINNTNIKLPVDAYLSNAHLFNFSVDSLTNLMYKTGFSPVGIATCVEEMGDKLYMLAKKGKVRPIIQRKVNGYMMKTFLFGIDTAYGIKAGGYI